MFTAVLVFFFPGFLTVSKQFKMSVVQDPVVLDGDGGPDLKKRKSIPETPQQKAVRMFNDNFSHMKRANAKKDMMVEQLLVLGAKGKINYEEVRSSLYPELAAGATAKVSISANPAVQELDTSNVNQFVIQLDEITYPLDEENTKHILRLIMNATKSREAKICEEILCAVTSKPLVFPKLRNNGPLHMAFKDLLDDYYICSKATPGTKVVPGSTCHLAMSYVYPDLNIADYNRVMGSNADDGSDVALDWLEAQTLRGGFLYQALNPYLLVHTAIQDEKHAANLAKAAAEKGGPDSTRVEDAKTRLAMKKLSLSKTVDCPQIKSPQFAPVGVHVCSSVDQKVDFALTIAIFAKLFLDTSQLICPWWIRTLKSGKEQLESALSSFTGNPQSCQAVVEDKFKSEMLLPPETPVVNSMMGDVFNDIRDGMNRVTVGLCEQIKKVPGSTISMVEKSLDAHQSSDGDGKYHVCHKMWINGLMSAVKLIVVQIVLVLAQLSSADVIKKAAVKDALTAIKTWGKFMFADFPILDQCIYAFEVLLREKNYVLGKCPFLDIIPIAEYCEKKGHALPHDLSAEVLTFVQKRLREHLMMSVQRFNKGLARLLSTKESVSTKESLLTTISPYMWYADESQQKEIESIREQLLAQSCAVVAASASSSSSSSSNVADQMSLESSNWLDALFGALDLSKNSGQEVDASKEEPQDSQMP